MFIQSLDGLNHVSTTVPSSPGVKFISDKIIKAIRFLSEEQLVKLMNIFHTFYSSTLPVS